MYGSSALWGFASVTNHQKPKVFIRYSISAGFYSPDPDYDFEQLCNETDHRLFNTILKSQFHVLEQQCCHRLFHVAIILENGLILDAVVIWLVVTF